MKRKLRRMHTQDAVFLRDMVLSLSHRILELENAVGALQQSANAPQTEILEESLS